MIKKITLFFAVLFSICKINAQTTQLNEGFTAPFNAVGAGWFIQNNSVPTGTTTWHQGQSSVFAANSGGPNDFFAADFSSQGATTGGISNFLITPTVTIVNGGVLKFATRTVQTVNYPDRIQVLYSLGLGTGGIGSGTTAVGSFTSLGYINPSLTTTGYPTVWTVYGLTLTSVSGSGPGRFAFRYFVDDSGPNGANGEYVGLDDVQYTTPTCAPPSVSINASSPILCGGGSVLLTASGASSYTWSTGSNAASINVSPSSTTVYTLSGSNTPGCEGVTSTTISVVSQPTISATDATLCSAGSVILTASGAASYTWSNGATTPTISVSPSANTTYTVVGAVGSCIGSTTTSVYFASNPTISASDVTVCANALTTLTASGASTYTWGNGGTGSSISFIVPPYNFNMSVTGFNGPNCYSTKIISVTINTFIIAPSVTTCPNAPTVVGASGAITYNWNTGATSASIIVTPTANTIYTVTGNNGTCSDTKMVYATVNPNLSVPNLTTCAATAATIIATGATSYTWSNGSNSSLIVVTPSANTVYTVTGSNGTCSDTKTVSVTIGSNLSINTTYSCISGGAIVLTASGASSYTWLPTGGNSPSIIFTPTAATVYTVNGSSGTCNGTRTVTVAYCAGLEEYENVNGSMVIYPNPFTNELNIKDAYGDVYIFNTLGQIILTTTVTESTTINTDAFAPGIYYIRVTVPNTNERRMLKVIKN